MTPAMEREQTTYSSLPTRAGAVLIKPEPIPPRLVRGCIATAFTACVPAVTCSHRLADAVRFFLLAVVLACNYYTVTRLYQRRYRGAARRVYREYTLIQ